MENKRHGLRIRCNDKCVLVLNGAKHECTMENISISGALLQMSGSLPRISAGSRCSLLLCNDPNVQSGGYACQVMRLTPTEVGLKFVNMR